MKKNKRKTYGLFPGANLLNYRLYEKLLISCSDKKALHFRAGLFSDRGVSRLL